MRLIFDVWIGGKKEFSFEENLVLRTMYDFVEDRIMVLEKELTYEEDEKPLSPICVMIELKRKRISFLGYSDHLIEKLKSCFNENDEKLLALQFEKAFSYLN